MLKALAFGLGAGSAVQAWRNWPATGDNTPWSVVAVFIVGIAAAYLAGRWHGRGGASAVAVASAEATAVASNQTAVNVFTVLPGAGARPVDFDVPSESVSWMGAPRPAITAADLDGADLSELFLEHDPQMGPE